MEWYYFILLAAIANGLYIIVTKKALLKEHSIEFSSAHSIVVLLLSLPLLFFIDLNLKLSQVAMIYIASSLYTIAFFCRIKAIRHTDISIVTPLMIFTPVVTSALAVILLGEHLRGLQVAGIALLLLGAYILQIRNKHARLLEPLKAMFASKYSSYLFASVLLFSFFLLMIRMLTNSANPGSVEPITYIVLQNVFVALNFFVISTLFFNGFKAYKEGFQQSRLMFTAAFLILALGIFRILAITMPDAKLALVSALSEVYILLDVYVGGRLFHEKNIGWKLAGTLVMLIGVYIVLQHAG